jgi:hypothetical protein
VSHSLYPNTSEASATVYTAKPLELLNFGRHFAMKRNQCGKNGRYKFKNRHKCARNEAEAAKYMTVT